MRLARLCRTFLFAFILLVIISAGALTGNAQSTARLSGVVKDTTGATIADASVTLTNQNTNVSHKTKTDSDGAYLFSLVDIGTYTVTVEHPGFKKHVQTGIVLELNQNGRLDLTLEVGQNTEVVEVSAEVAQVDTSGAVLGKVEDTRRIQDLPLVDRDTLQLGLLQAGVFTPDPDDGSGNPFNVSGQRSESLTFMVDGADNTDFLGNNIVVSPNPDAVAEFKILTNNYDAEFGRSSGGIVNQVVKSGTNQIHGSAFEFLRNTVFNARDFFLTERSPFQRNVFGGSLGAPIRKDKTFIFGSYQGARRREGQASPQLTVLSSAERTGNFGELCPSAGGSGSGFDGSGNCTNPDGTQLYDPVSGNPYPYNQVPVNPISANYINKYLPLPNRPNNGYQFSATSAINEDQGILRADHNFTSRDILSGIYLIDDVREAFPFIIGKGASSGGNLPVGSGFATDYRDQVLSLTYTHSFASGWINELRGSANRTATLQATPDDHTSPSELGFTNINPDDPAGVAPPIMYTSGFNIGPSPQGPTKLHNMVYQAQDHVTIPHGRHEWKFGFDFHRVQNNFNYDFYTNGSYDFGLYGYAPDFGTFTGTSLSDFVGGFPDNYYQSANAVYGIRTSSYFAYGQDTFKISPRLTLVLGLRYEYNTPQYDVHNNILGYFGPGAQSTVWPDAPPGILYPGDPGTPNRALVYPDRNNWAPRFGFAWDMLGNSKVVMRGGFGIFYDIEDGALNLQFGGQPPYGDISNLYYGATQFATTDNALADPFTPLGITNPYPFRASGHVGEFFIPKISFAYVTDPHFRTPYSENFNYGFQFQVTKTTALEAVYVGSYGRKLISSVDVNPPSPSVELQQLNNLGYLNIDCARPLSGCVNGATDPNATLQSIGQLYTNTSSGVSEANELQVTVDRRFSHGLSFRGAYTFGKTMDLTSGFRSRSSTYTDPFDPSLDRGPADFDVRNRFVFSGSWEIPIGNRLQDNRFARNALGGWQVNTIVTFQSGTPFTLYSNAGSSGQGNLLERVDIINPVVKYNPRKLNSFDSTCGGGTDANYYFDPSSFDCSLAYNTTTVPPGSLASFGDMGRNAIYGPGINNWDISFLKRFSFTESKNLEFRAEMFNAFNHVQFLNPDNQGYSGTFGQVSTDRGPRIVQFGLKFYF
jgi:Carboxypeptidase regulatory-like domain/TonB dependent receptor